jgi:hypothetical protein
VQKFTRPLTREITLAGERLSLTFTEAGVSVRPVGSRKPPREISWGAFLHLLATGPTAEPGSDQLLAAVQAVKGGTRPTPPATPAPDTQAQPPAATAPHPAAHHSSQPEVRPPHPGSGEPTPLSRPDH